MEEAQLGWRPDHALANPAGSSREYSSSESQYRKKKSSDLCSGQSLREVEGPGGELRQETERLRLSADHPPAAENQSPL